MSEAYICDAIRTPVGRYGGGLSSIRTDDLAAIPIRGLMERNSKVEWGKLDDIVYGCAKPFMFNGSKVEICGYI